MPAKAKPADEQVNEIGRRVRAGARLTELAAQYQMNCKTPGSATSVVAFPTEGDIAGMATTWSKTAHFFKNGPTK